MKNESCAATKAMFQLLSRVTQKHHTDLLMVGETNSFRQRPALICISMRHELYFAVYVYIGLGCCVFVRGSERGWVMFQRKWWMESATVTNRRACWTSWRHNFQLPSLRNTRKMCYAPRVRDKSLAARRIICLMSLCPVQYQQSLKTCRLCSPRFLRFRFCI